MEILKNYDLSKLNTFGVKVNAAFFVEIKSETDLQELFESPEFIKSEKIFLGGGSNVLFTKDFDGFVVLNKLKGIEITNENSETADIRAMGGESWNDLVIFSVEHGYWGIENLSLVPGTVGAAPMQNIGAYGAEIKDTLLNVEAFYIGTGIKKIFTKEECELGYRSSVFKNKLKGKYFISAVSFKLSKIKKVNTNYRALKEYLETSKIEIHTSKDVCEAVASVRRSKLPDPKILGNAGSFFKNVFINNEQLQKLQTAFPNIPSYKELPANKEMENEVKIPAGWLIEQCGPLPQLGMTSGKSWKGYREGNVGVHNKQALVLVNYGGATGEEVLELANKIISSVEEKFGLKLTTEVNLI